MYNRSKCCIIGIPDHQGVIHVGGRIGASGGPQAFRKIFSKMKGKEPLKAAVSDEGDVPDLGVDVVSNLQRAAEFIKNRQRSFDLSVVIGGGHDHGYSHLLGVSQCLREINSRLRLGCINIDAHLDVRRPDPLITSGSPFYLALESRLIESKRFVEFGIQSHCNSPDLWKYVEDKKVHVVPFQKLRHGKAVASFKDHLRKLALVCDSIVVSLDLDAAASAFSPGVSAPQAEGFTSMEVIEMMEIAGREKKVSSLGVFELNPEHDLDHRSARLAATSVYHFIQAALF